MDSDSLQTTGPVELQKLGVVLNTIFLGSQSRTAEVDFGRRFSTTDRHVISRVSSFDQGPGAPFEDLRRRLATINGSSSSLNSAMPKGRTSLGIPLAPASPMPKETTNTVDLRPGSPTESIVSTTNSVSFKPRFSLGGVIEGQKAAPAVGSVRANAMGVLEAPGRLHSDSTSDRPGWTSPLPFAQVAGGIRSQILSNNIHDGTALITDPLFELLTMRQMATRLRSTDCSSSCTRMRTRMLRMTSDLECMKDQSAGALPLGKAFQCAIPSGRPWMQHLFRI